MWVSLQVVADTSTTFVQVFFVPDKANPGWSVVLQKEARGRRITSNEEDQHLGQEESSGDRDVFTPLGGQRREAGDENDVFVDTQLGRRERQRRWH